MLSGKQGGNMPTKKDVDKWAAQSRARRELAKKYAAEENLAGLKALVATQDDFEAFTRAKLGLDDA